MSRDRMATILLSQGLPPNRSGSAHIVKELLSNATDEDRLLVLGGRSPLSSPERLPRVFTFPTEFSLFGRGARFFTVLRAPLFPLVVAWIRVWIRRHRAQKVVCVFPDGFYCFAAYVAVAGSNVALEYWFHNSYAPNRTHVLGVLARWIERLMFDRADKIHCLSDALCQLYADAYPDAAHKICTTRHPAGEPLPVRPIINQRPAIFKCLLIGNINESNRDATARLFAVINEIPNAQIMVATQVPRKLLLLRGIPLKNVQYLGYLTDAALESVALDSDVLLLPHGLSGAYASEEYATIFPTRATYYFRLGKPVFSLCPEGSYLAHFLNLHKCAKVCTSPAAPDIRAAFLELLEDAALRHSVAVNAFAAANLFSTRYILEQLIGFPRPVDSHGL